MPYRQVDMFRFGLYSGSLKKIRALWKIAAFSAKIRFLGIPRAAFSPLCGAKSDDFGQNL